MSNTGITKSISDASSDGKWRTGDNWCRDLRSSNSHRQNGMRALDQLGVAETLRRMAIPVQRYVTLNKTVKPTHRDLLVLLSLVWSD